MRKVLVDQEWLKRLHRDLDACQKVIWLGLRGADPAYCQDAQDRLKEIDELLAQPAEAEGVQTWRERIIAAYPRSEPGYWPDTLLVEHMQSEIDELRAALSAVTAERDRLREAAELLSRLRGLINCTPENDIDKIPVWISTKHPTIERIDALLVAMAAKEA